MPASWLPTRREFAQALIFVGVFTALAVLVLDDRAISAAVIATGGALGMVTGKRLAEKRRRKPRP